MNLLLLSCCCFLCYTKFDVFGVPVSEFQYGAILDAGSTSTKTHLYRWNKKIDEHTLPKIEEIYYKKHKPGLSSFVDHKEGIEEYLADVLFDLQSAIPRNDSNVVLYLMATAGLRLLGETKAQSLLNRVKMVFNNDSINPFPVSDNNIQILSGEEEAVFSWISVNYLTETFQNNENTYGLIEIGGGSIQVAFVPEVPIFAGKSTIKIGENRFNLYIHSFLSYGSTSMMKRIRNFLLQENPHATAVMEPCMLKGDNSKITANDKEMELSGEGNVTQCQDIINHFLSKVPDTYCSPKPCSIGSIYTPSIPWNSRFIGLGSIYNTASELQVLNESGHLDPQKLQEEAMKYCSKTLQEADEQYGIPAKWASADCRNGLYISMFLKTLGFTDDIDSQIYAVKQINGDTVAWSLGAMIYEIENEQISDVKK